VLQRLRGLGDAATCLLGNHDLHLLAVAHGVRPACTAATRWTTSCSRPHRDAWLDWLRSAPPGHVEAGWLCVHAGVVPPGTRARTLALASEVQALLRRAPTCPPSCA
jgi:bis(5'-nucleosyl)-tetraphosphatase (symmetrical)